MSSFGDEHLRLPQVSQGSMRVSYQYQLSIEEISIEMSTWAPPRGISPPMWPCKVEPCAGRWLTILSFCARAWVPSTVTGLVSS